MGGAMNAKAIRLPCRDRDTIWPGTAGHANNPPVISLFKFALNVYPHNAIAGFDGTPANEAKSFWDIGHRW